MKIIAAVVALFAFSSPLLADERSEKVDRLEEISRIRKIATRGRDADQRVLTGLAHQGAEIATVTGAVGEVTATVKDWKARSNFDPMLLVYAALGLTGAGGGALLIRKVLKGPQAILAALADQQAAVAPGGAQPTFHHEAPTSRESHGASGGQTGQRHGVAGDQRHAAGPVNGNGLSPADKVEVARTAAHLAEAQNPRSSRG